MFSSSDDDEDELVVPVKTEEPTVIKKSKAPEKIKSPPQIKASESGQQQPPRVIPPRPKTTS